MWNNHEWFIMDRKGAYPHQRTFSSMDSDLSSPGPMLTANISAYVPGLAQSLKWIIKVLVWIRVVVYLPSIHEYFWGSINWEKLSISGDNRDVWLPCLWDSSFPMLLLFSLFGLLLGRHPVPSIRSCISVLDLPKWVHARQGWGSSTTDWQWADPHLQVHRNLNISR